MSDTNNSSTKNKYLIFEKRYIPESYGRVYAIDNFTFEVEHEPHENSSSYEIVNNLDDAIKLAKSFI